MIDLRSDTVTRPSEGMRAAIATAVVGDDVYGEDPTVNLLQDRVAELFDREAALFVSSGVMANLLWTRVFAPPATEVVSERWGHAVAYEDGAGAVGAGVQYLTVEGDRGRLDEARVRAALRPAGWPHIRTSMIAAEETTNRGGGAIHGLDRLRGLRTLADELDAKLHVDGARLFNAIVASGTKPAEYAAVAHGLNFCLSKGLGAPVGSVMIGDRDAIDEARVWRRRVGGAMRQIGILAAAGLYALDHNVDRLADDHANARRIAAHLAEAVPGSADPDLVDTNILFVETGERPAADVAAEARDAGVLVSPFGPHVLRMVTHLDVSEADGDTAATVLTGALRPA